MARITWKDGEYASATGHVGRLRLFTISYKTRRADPDFTLSTDLMGFTTQEWKNDDENVLKERAERVLEAFVKELGAVFPASLPGEEA
jgi:hypothetical protein